MIIRTKLVRQAIASTRFLFLISLSLLLLHRYRQYTYLKIYKIDIDLYLVRKKKDTCIPLITYDKNSHRN
jgi:hypothetical protein